MNWKRVKSDLWELKAYGREFYGKTKGECLEQLTTWWKGRKAFDYSTGLPLE